MRHQLAFLNTLINNNKAWAVSHNSEFYTLAFTDDYLVDFRLQVELSGFNWGIFLLTKDDLNNYSPIHIVEPSHPLFNYRSHTVKSLRCALQFFDDVHSTLKEFIRNKVEFVWPFPCENRNDDLSNRFLSYLYGNHLTYQLNNNIEKDTTNFLSEIGFKPTQHKLNTEMEAILKNTFYDFCRQLKPKETNTVSVPLINKLRQQYVLNVDAFNDNVEDIGKIAAVVQGIKQNISLKRGLKVDVVILFSEDLYRHFPYLSDELDTCAKFVTSRCNDLYHVSAQEIVNRHKNRNLRLSFITQDTSLHEGMIFTEFGLQNLTVTDADFENDCEMQLN